MRCKFTLPILALILFINCENMFITGSGTISSINIKTTSFKNIDISHGCEAEINHADSFYIIVFLDDNIVPYLIKRVENGTLKIGLDPLKSYHPTKFKVVISCPYFEDLTASGGSSFLVNQFDLSSDITLSLSGGSSIKGDFHSGNLVCNMSGGSKANLVGSSGNLKANLSGGSKGYFSKLNVENVTTNLSGGSVIHVNANGVISGNLSGGSKLYYSGIVSLGSINKSGGSELIRE